jgi:hypothetical protein
MWPLGSLSADPVVLAEQLERSHPVSNGPAERLVAVTDLVAEQPCGPMSAPRSCATSRRRPAWL